MIPIVFPGDTYTTPEGSAGFWASRFPSLFFTVKVAAIVRHEGSLAAKGGYDGAAWCRGSLATLRALECCGVEIEVTGMNNIDAVDGPCVFIANHMSTLETFVLPVLIQPRRRVTFVVKESLLNFPWFGKVLASRNPVAVRRVNPREDLTTVLEGGTALLEGGTSIIVFPQSTRSFTFDLSRFNSIGVKLARRAGVPVIPVALRSDAWGVGRVIKDFGPIRPSLPVRFAFGEPMAVTGNGKAEHAEVCRFISSRMEAWGLPPALPAASPAAADAALPPAGPDA